MNPVPILDHNNALLASLYHGDCLDVMNHLDSESIDLTVTSPPYDDLRTYKDTLQWNETIWKQVLDGLYRVTKAGGVVVWVVGDATINGSETGTSFKQALYAKEIGFSIHDTMIYAKDNPPPTGGNNRYYQAFEYMFVFTKGTPNTFNPIVTPRRNKWNDKRTVRIRPVTRNKAGTFTERRVVVNTDNVRLQNVWNYVVSYGSVSEDREAHEHPAIFPESLARDHIISWSNHGDTVFDPFMGSGTTGKMAICSDRIFIGSERVEDYFNIAKERIHNAVGYQHKVKTANTLF